MIIVQQLPQQGMRLQKQIKKKVEKHSETNSILTENNAEQKLHFFITSNHLNINEFLITYLDVKYIFFS